jgi:mannose-6-phosphate isomerase-like protein (cupin superfamily)
MNTRRFDHALATRAHNDTCLSMPVLPEGMSAPFRHAWVLVAPHTEMEGHAHATRETYILTRGTSAMIIDQEVQLILPGTAVEIPPHSYHAVRNDTTTESLWLVLYWDAE